MERLLILESIRFRQVDLMPRDRHNDGDNVNLLSSENFVLRLIKKIWNATLNLWTQSPT